MATRRVAPDEYSRTTWADGAEGGTAITAARLNNIEDAIEDVTNYAIDDDEDLGDAEQAIADNAAAIAELASRLGSCLKSYTAQHSQKETIAASSYASIDVALIEDTATSEYKVVGITGIRPYAANKNALVCVEYYTYTTNTTYGKKTMCKLIIKNLTSSAVTTQDKPQVMFCAYEIKK